LRRKLVTKDRHQDRSILKSQNAFVNYASGRTDAFTHWGSKTCDCMGFQRMKLFGPDDAEIFRGTRNLPPDAKSVVLSKPFKMPHAVRRGAACSGSVRRGVVRRGVVRRGAAFLGAARCGAVRYGAVRCGVVRRGAAWCGAVLCGAVLCGSVRRSARALFLFLVGISFPILVCPGDPHRLHRVRPEGHRWQVHRRHRSRHQVSVRPIGRAGGWETLRIGLQRNMGAHFAAYATSADSIRIHH
jgi:hypothetical protein